MDALLALTTGLLFACAFYSLMRRGSAGIAVALLLLGHATNLLIFGGAGLRRGPAPIWEEGAAVPPQSPADPLPQALILTAIVINFGMFAFALVLLFRAWRLAGEATTGKEETPQ